MKEKTEKAQCCGVAVDGGLDAAVGDDVERLVCVQVGWAYAYGGRVGWTIG